MELTTTIKIVKVIFFETTIVKVRRDKKTSFIIAGRKNGQSFFFTIWENT